MTSSLVSKDMKRILEISYNTQGLFYMLTLYPTPPHHHHHHHHHHYFLQHNFVFRRKIEKQNFYMWRTYEFIYWTRHKWQKVDSFFWICCFSCKLTYHSYQQRVCKIMLLIRTFVKTNVCLFFNVCLFLINLRS